MRWAKVSVSISGMATVSIVAEASEAAIYLLRLQESPV
jgi:hypothetical protein